MQSAFYCHRFLMYNLYQSHLRKNIQYNVLQKPSFTVDFLGKTYTGTKKTKSFGPFTLSRYQLLGVELPKDAYYVRKEIKRLKKELSGKGVIMLQFGIINEIIRFPNISHRSKTFQDDMKDMRLSLRRHLCQTYPFRVSFRENMPQANIVYDISKSDEGLLKDMKKSCKERVKKAINRDIQFTVASPEQYEQFYQKRLSTAGKKGFNILPKDDYYKLITYMKKHDCGELFIAHKDGDIVAGSICAYDETRIIYLYGFSDRKYRNIGGHHFLKFKIFGRARDKKGLVDCDMLGGAPTGFNDHALAGVSKFKESLGGEKIEVYGNYDIVLQPLRYRLFKWYFQRKK